MRPLSILAFLLLASGCAGEEPQAPATAEGTAIRTEMRAADLSGIDRAFERLAQTPHRETVRIEQLDATGRAVAYHQQAVERSGGAARVLAADSAGRFDYGAFGSFADTPSARTDSARSPLRWMLTRGEGGYEPAYLTERARDAYAYERLPGGTGFQATAQLGEGDEQAVRLVRYRTAPTGYLRGLVLERENAATLFDERTRLEVELSAGTDALPERVLVESRVAAPFAETRRFRLTRAFEPLR